MKKIFAAIMSVVLISFYLAGCGNAEKADIEKISIVSTIFPTYDFAKQICGENAVVTMLMPPGMESHSYEPSARDIIKIQNCDLFIYVGGESDSWVDGILESIDKPVRSIKMMDCVNVVEEETAEGMEDKASEATAVAEEPGAEYDQHVWTSPRNAIKITEAVSEAVCEIDKENSATYKKNTASYVEKLDQLDKSFSDFFAGVKNKTIIFGDRFPFRYFVDAYGLNYYAAFPGCSSQTEPSAETIAFLIGKVKTDNLSTVFHIEFSNHKIADSIAEATNTKTGMLHSCHSVSKSDLNAGATYLSLMEQNLETLKEAMK